MLYFTKETVAKWMEKNYKLFKVIEPIDLSELEKSLGDGITQHHLMGRRDSGTAK